MATEEMIARLRRMTGELEPDSNYTSTELGTILDEAASDLNVAASRIWGEKAGMVADLVNISEAGSSRSNSDLFAHAKDRQSYFASLAGEPTVTDVGSSTTRRIERV